MVKKKTQENKEYETLSVVKKDKKKFNDLCNKYDLERWQMFQVLVKILKEYKPEVHDLVKNGKSSDS